MVCRFLPKTPIGQGYHLELLRRSCDVIPRCAVKIAGARNRNTAKMAEATKHTKSAALQSSLQRTRNRFVQDPVDQGGRLGFALFYTFPETCPPKFCRLWSMIAAAALFSCCTRRQCPSHTCRESRQAGWHMSLCTNHLASLWPIGCRQGLFHLSRTEWMCCLSLEQSCQFCSRPSRFCRGVVVRMMCILVVCRTCSHVC